MSFDSVNKYCGKSKRCFAKETGADLERERRRKANQNWLDEFENTKQYIEAKLVMLRNDMYIEPTEEEIDNLMSLKTETAINNAVHSIIDKHWASF